MTSAGLWWTLFFRVAPDHPKQTTQDALRQAWGRRRAVSAACRPLQHSGVKRRAALDSLGG
eukprot:15448050-Alexandrium_andersonii.AAC.1